MGRAFQGIIILTDVAPVDSVARHAQLDVEESTGARGLSVSCWGIPVEQWPLQSMNMAPKQGPTKGSRLSNASTGIKGASFLFQCGFESFIRRAPLLLGHGVRVVPTLG